MSLYISGEKEVLQSFFSISLLFLRVSTVNHLFTVCRTNSNTRQHSQLPLEGLCVQLYGYASYDKRRLLKYDTLAPASLGPKSVE